MKPTFAFRRSRQQDRAGSTGLPSPLSSRIGALATGRKAHEQDRHRRQGNRRPGRVHASPGVRGGGGGSSAVLLPRAAVDRGQLSDVPGRSEGRPAQADGLLRDGGEDLRPGPNGEPPVVETNSPMARKARQGRWSSCSSTIRSIARSATRAASAICRIRRWPTAPKLALSREQARRSKTNISGRSSRRR